MIESQDPVIDADRQIRNREFIRGRAGQSFKIMAQVIAEEPGDPALERRQIGVGLTSELAENFGEARQRINRLFAAGNQPKERIGRHVGIAAKGRMRERTV